MPVVENDRVIGLIDESDLLGALLTDPDGSERAFARPAKDVMATRLETISADASIADLVPLFRRGYVAIVMDKDRFIGLVTPFDMIKYEMLSCLIPGRSDSSSACENGP